jgi:chemotaxis protein methyltransferase CheR
VKALHKDTAADPDDRQGPTSGQPIPITDSEFAQVRELAMRVAGISIAASKKALIVGRWSKRLHHHRLTNFKDYLALLSGANAGAEPQIALDLLTTNETNFFREPKHFDFIRDQVLPAVKPGHRFRVWSAACSSGEEPYSVAMVLAAQLPNGLWDVLGTDISSRVLDTARAGLYELTRSNPIPRAYLQRFCLKGNGPHAGKFLIDRTLRDRVQFTRANLNEPMADYGQFDVIMLRNVMIYFDARTKERVVKHLLPALKPGGYFIIGHCDTLAGVSHSLASISASVYRKEPV